MIDLNVLSNRVLVKRFAQKEEKIGSIIIPSERIEKKKSCKVLAVGPGKLNKDGTRTPVDVNVGDTVLVHAIDGDPLDLSVVKALEIKLEDGEELLMVYEQEIMAVLEPGAKEE